MEQEKPEDDDGNKEGIFEDIMLRGNDRCEPNYEKVDEAGVKTHHEKHLWGKAIPSASFRFSFQIIYWLLPVLAISDPKWFFLGKPAQEILNEPFIIKVEVKLKDVDNDDNVELVINGKNDWAEEIKYAILICYGEVG